jgi:putative ABC transport system substrate-binding protein
MRRRRLLLLIGSSLGWVLAAHAEPPAVRRIGVLIPSHRADETVLQPFRENLHDLGYIEGRDIQLEIRSANGRLERLPRLAAELVGKKVDLIAAWMTPSVLAAKRATTEIPIVMIGAGDPVGTGLVASLARPGGNITGIAGETAELAGKNLEFLKEMLPSLRRAAALCNTPDPFSRPFLQQVQSAGWTLSVEIVPIMVGDEKEFGAAFQAMLERQIDGVIVQPSLPLERAAEMALHHRLPAASPLRPFPDLGGLMAYVGAPTDASRRAAAFVDEILKGRRPAELPVERPTRFELVVNLKTAGALGVTVPSDLLVRTDQVIE